MKKSEQKKWQNILPVTILVVIVGLGFALYWFSPANQEQLAYTMRDVELTPTKTYGEWMEYFGIEIGITPNPEPLVKYLEPGEHTLIIRGREPNTLLDKVQILSVQDATSTAAAWTPTPFPICTAVACPNGNLVCPAGQVCLGGCGVVCEAYTPTPTLPPVFLEVRVTGESVSDQRGLNVRRDAASLYNSATAFFIPPDCQYKPGYSWCINEPAKIIELIQVPKSAANKYDAGYWGRILCEGFCDDQSEYFIPLCTLDPKDNKSLRCFTDWRP